MSLAQRFLRSLTHLTLVVGGLICAGVIATAAEPTIAAERPQVTDSPAALLAVNDCWTGEAPADMQGKVPGHVVVTLGGQTRFSGERMVGKALAQIFDGADHGLTIHGFCR